MRVFVEGGICIGRATGYKVRSKAGRAGVRVTLEVDSDNESLLLFAEAIVAKTCTCDQIEGGERLPIEGCPVHSG